MKKYILLLFFALLYCPNAAFAGGGGFGGATEMTQLANNSELGAILGENAEQVANQVKQLTNQVKQLKELYRQGKGLADRVSSITEIQFNNLSNVIYALTGLYRSGANVGKNLADEFEKAKSKESTTPEEREASTEATALSVGRAIEEANKQQKEDLLNLQKMYNRNYSATTPMQAAQITNEIGLLANEQMIKSRTDVNNISVLLLEEKLRRVQEREATKKFYRELSTDPGEINVKFNDKRNAK